MWRETVGRHNPGPMVGERHASKGLQGQRSRIGPILVMYHSKGCISKTQIWSCHSFAKLPTEKCPKSLADVSGPSQRAQLICLVYFYYSTNLNNPAAPATALLVLSSLPFSLVDSMNFHLFYEVHLNVTSSLGLQMKLNVSSPSFPWYLSSCLNASTITSLCLWASLIWWMLSPLTSHTLLYP